MAKCRDLLVIQCCWCKETFTTDKAELCEGNHVPGYEGSTNICPHCGRCACERVAEWEAKGVLSDLGNGNWRHKDVLFVPPVCKLCGSDQRILDDDGVCADWFNCQREQIARLKAEVERLTPATVVEVGCAEDCLFNTDMSEINKPLACDGSLNCFGPGHLYCPLTDGPVLVILKPQEGKE